MVKKLLLAAAFAALIPFAAAAQAPCVLFQPMYDEAKAAGDLQIHLSADQRKIFLDNLNASAHELGNDGVVVDVEDVWVNLSLDDPTVNVGFVNGKCFWGAVHMSDDLFEHLMFVGPWKHPDTTPKAGL
jgi:hypothetical protein